MAEEKPRKKPYALNTEDAAPQEESAPAENDPVEQERPSRPKPSAQKSGKSRPAQGNKKRRRKRKRSGVRWLFVLIPLLLILAAGGYYFLHTYVVIGTNIIRRDARSVDLRQSSISPETYEAISEKLPEAEILWKVPFGGGEYSCDSESVVISRFSEDDLTMIPYFKGITYVDAENAELTSEQYEALVKALPGATIDWSVPVGDDRFLSDSETIKLTEFSEEDIPRLAYLPNLRTVDARSCRNYPAVLALREARPDLTVTWQVPVSGKEYLDDAEEILVDDPSVSVQQLSEALRYLPKVKSVDAPENAWSLEEKDALCEQWPDISFHWPVTICGTVYNGSETTLDLKGSHLTENDIAEIEKYGHYLPDITRLDMTDTGLSVEDAVRIKNVFPDAAVDITVELYGKQVSSEDTFIDFTGVKMGSMEPLEAALPLLTKLEKVDMSDCGFSDEDMDALNKRHENVRFIWTMYFGRSSVIRTDDQGFIGTMDHYLQFNNSTIRKLTYCEDMVCLDLGHRVPTGLKLDFLYGMPQMKFLVLADCRATDITPIGSLKNLIYLEMVMAYVNDLSPLKECTSLLDLDVCFSYNTYNQRDKNYEIFVSMADHLERLWYSSQMIDADKVASLAAAMPNTDVHCIYATAQATGEGWRYHKRYYEMRDYLHMIYMSDYGGRQYSKIIDGVEIPLTKEFMATQREPDWSKIRR